MNLKDKEQKKQADKAIAYFMGWRIDNSFPDKDKVWRKGSNIELDTTMKWSEDWNLLQSVVEAIENIGFNFHTHKARVRIELDDNGLMAGLKDPEIEVRSSTVDFDKKLATYVAVVRFVTWYNVLQIGKI